MITEISNAGSALQANLQGVAQMLLQSKLDKPLVPDVYCKRTSLLDTFAEGIGRRLTVVQAPAGYGKTQALLAWVELLQARGISNSWLSVDEKDNDLQRFLRYLIQSISSAVGDVGKDSQDHNSRLSQDPDYEALLSPLLRDLALKGQQLVICLDNMQLIDSDQVWQCLNFLIDHLPPQVSLILSSRKPLPLALNRWALRQQLLQIGITQLSWETQESVQLLEKITPEPQDKEQLKLVAEQARGWVTGLQIMTLAGADTNSSDPSHYSAKTLLDDYFACEVLVHCDDSSKQKLSQLAQLERFNRLLCETLFAESGTLLFDSLVQGQLFIVNLDSQGNWYSFHPLFKQVLLEGECENKKQLFLQVSQWYESQGAGVEAIEYALAAKDQQRAAQLAELTTESILADQDIQRLKRWRTELPESLITNSSRLTLLFAWASALAMQLDDAEYLIGKLNMSQADRALEGRVLAVKGYIARGRGQIDRSIALCEDALAHIENNSAVASILAMSTLANAYLTLKDVKTAEVYNQEALELARRSADGGLEMLALYDGARLEMAKGQLKGAQRLLSSAQEIHQGMGLFPTTAVQGRILMTQGSVAWLQNEPEKAQQFLQKGIQLAEGCHDVAVLIGYIVHSALLRQQRRYDEAMDLLFRAERTMQMWNVPRGIYNSWISAVRANLWVDQGKTELAEECLSALRSMNQTAPEYFPALPGCIDLFYARVKFAGKDFVGALGILDQLVTEFRHHKFGFNHSLCLLLRSLVSHHSRDEQASLSDLNEALAYAESENCIAPFLEYSDELLAVIKKIPSPSPRHDFVQQLLKQIEVKGPETPEVDTSQVKVSARELGVLKLIAEGCSNQEIADRLYISLHTVKTHARKINNKLAAKSRTQAIVKARDLGLI